MPDTHPRRRVEAVVFDMDDVLCRYDMKGRQAALARLAGTTAEAVHEAIWASGFEDSADAGGIDAEAYLAAFGQRIGYPLSRAEWLAARTAAMHPDAAMLDLVGRLRPHVTLAVLTNNGPLLEAHIDQAFPELRPLFGERIFFSWSFGTAKPDPAIFTALCARLGVAPAATLFTDDKPENAAAAATAGLLGHTFTGVSSLRAALREAGLADV